MKSTFQMSKYTQLIQQLENDELEKPDLDAVFYTQLLASYIYQNDLTKAKHLWMRIPQPLKANEELECLHQLLKAQIHNNTADFFKIIKFRWSEGSKAIISDLTEKVREDVFALIGNAYTSIFEHNLMHLTQLTREELQEQCQKLDWTYETYGQQVLVIPKPPPVVEAPDESSEDQLFKLTDFVSFLES